jgi:hypothetical protein
MPRITLIVTAALTALVLSAAVATAVPTRDQVGTSVAPTQDLRNPDNRVVRSASSSRDDLVTTRINHNGTDARFAFLVERGRREDFTGANNHRKPL